MATVSPVRLSPSGRKLADLEVSGWNVVRTLADLPAPDGSGERTLDPGGWQFLPDPNEGLEIPSDETIVLAGAGGDGHHIVGNMAQIQHGPSPHTVPLFRVDISANRTWIEGLNIFGDEDIAKIQVESSGPDSSVQITNCVFQNGTRQIWLPSDGSGPSNCVISVCHFLAATEGVTIEDPSSQVTIQGSKFWAMTNAIHHDQSSSAALMQVLGCTFESIDKAIRWSDTGHLVISGNYFMSLSDALFSDTNKATAGAIFNNNQGFSGGNAVTFLPNAGTQVPADGVSVVGCNFSSWANIFNGPGVDPSNADIYGRANFLNGVKQTESTITP